VSDEIIDFYKKVSDTEEPQKPIEEQKETPAPVLPQPDEPFDKFLLELAEKLKTEKVITEKQQETFEEQIKQPVLEEDKNSDDPFKKFIGSFANILKQDELVNREENIKEATINFINKLKEQPEEPFIIKDQPFVKTKKKYLPPTIAKKVQKLPQLIKKEEPVVAEQSDEPLKEEPKDENKYVQELKTADKTNKKIPEKIKSVSDIKSIVEKQVAEILSRYPNLGFTGSGGGTNAVQYAEGGTMRGDLNITGKYLSGGVDISTLFGSGGGAVSGIPDRLISGTETLILCSDGSISFPNNFISAPDGQVLNIQSETSSPSSFSRISLTPYAFFAYDNEGNSISFDVIDNTIELISQNEYSWKFNNRGVLVGPGNTLTVTSLSSLGKILSGGKDLLDIFALSGTGGGGGTGRGDVNTIVISNSANWNTAYNTATAYQSASGDYILNGGNTKGLDITIGTNDGYSLNFETSGVTRMIVTDTGNFGINTTTPSCLFDIYSTSLSKSVFTVNESTGVGTASNGFVIGNQIGGYVDSGNHKAQIVAPDGGGMTPLTLAGGSALMEFYKDSAASAAVSFGMAVPGNAASNDLVFGLYDGGWYEGFRVLGSNLYFGIGTTTPSTKLEVDGTITTTSDGNSVQWNQAYNSLGNYLPLSGGTVTGNLSLQGNLYLTGSAAYINTQNLVVDDALIYLANSNPTNLLDIGFVAHFTQAPLGYQHTGLVRKSGQGRPGIWTLFSGLTTEPVSANNIDWNDKNLTIDALSADIYSSNGNSYQWSDTFTTVRSNSANWNTAYTSVQSNSASWFEPVRKFDYTTVLNVDYSYSGTAQYGTADNTPIWKLIRLTYANNGSISNSASAINSWTGRLTATYV